MRIYRPLNEVFEYCTLVKLKKKILNLRNAVSLSDVVLVHLL